MWARGSRLSFDYFFTFWSSLMGKHIAWIGVIVVVALSMVAYRFSGNNNTLLPQNVTPIESLPEAKSPQIIRLASGDTYAVDITEVKMNIAGKWVRMLSYNGSIPWPMIQVKQWATVNIVLTNKVSWMTTSLHSHGLRLNDAFDGVVKSMMWTQDPIQYGESFEYQLIFPDAGMFWYHPHLDEHVQQELGLYGNYLVSPMNEEGTTWFDAAYPVMLDDIQLTDDGTPQVHVNSENQMLMGRYWNQLLINGKEQYDMAASSWQVVRLYFTNTANVRPFYLSIRNAVIKLIASDLWTYERPTLVDHVLIGPAERYTVDVYFPTAGTYTLAHTTPEWSVTLGKIVVTDTQAPSKHAASFLDMGANQDTVSDIDIYRAQFERPVDKSLVIDMTMEMHGNMWGGMMGWMWGMWWMMNHKKPWAALAMPWLIYDSNSIERADTMQMMNDMSTADNTKWKLIDEGTRKENMDIKRSFRKWDVVKVRITNKGDSMHPMQHPIHFHGQRFLVLTHNGIRNTNLVRKDTVLLWAGDTVDILIEMSNPWGRMAHCHIAEHLMDGMMMHYDVVP